MTAGTERPPAPPRAGAPAALALVHELFRAQCRRTPDAVAVEHGERHLTYDRLDIASDRLARRLRKLGARPEQRIAVFLDRSPEAIVTILAVLKSGAAYVPIDPGYPAARIRLLAEEGDCRVVVTTTALLGRIDVPSLTPVLLDAPTADDDREGGPGGDAEPSNLAYVIFTSGSTGRPKGVAVPHAGLVQLALDQIPRWKAGPGARILQFASLSFDASFTEIAVALLSGATLCLAARDDLMPGAELQDTLRRLRITAVKTPPAVLTVTEADGLPDLEVVINGGGACRPAIVERWSAGRTMLNAYGTTECSVCSTITAPLTLGSRITLGEPLRGTTLHVLDGGRRVDAGEVGELYIGGAGVARGYWRQPSLTADRFVPDPYGPPGGRLYRTGDLARYTADGGFEYVGRIDDQVKVRGFRIEPGEVEAALLTAPSVREAVVTTRPHPAGGEDQLVAHVVRDRGATDPLELRSFLADRLPGHLIPSVFLTLDRMPVTAHGKVDRAALAGPVHEPPPAQPPPHGKPAGRLDGRELVTEVWRELLAVEEIGPHDDFFHLGGDSLQAAVCVARLREHLGIPVPLRTLLRGPTVAELGDELERLRRTTNAAADRHPG
ncbi:non-ribosomal peptide synthetase [Streptomyces lavendofoliae]|nr:non-ribosomal peptide synthetase [Streptomyces lavendofoliae]